jgi:hypothetical protein
LRCASRFLATPRIASPHATLDHEDDVERRRTTW